MFLMVTVRSDLSFIVSVLNQFVKVEINNWNGVNERIFKYLKGMINYSLVYVKIFNFNSIL